MKWTLAQLSLLVLLAIGSQYCSTKAQASTTAGLHVNDFKNIIGHAARENELLRFAQQHGFNYLLLYNLGAIHREQFSLTDERKAKPLARFIRRAKTKFGIRQIGVVGERLATFHKLIRYNQQHAARPDEQVDVLHLEFEFWNHHAIEKYYCADYLKKAGLACDMAGAFEFYHEQLLGLRQICQQNGLLAETYIGNTTAAQNAVIGSICDRVLVHYYRQSDVYKDGRSIYNYKANRLQELAPRVGTLQVLPIFSARESHMGSWLLEHDMDQAFDSFLYGEAGFEQEPGTWKAHIEIGGFQWYRYSDLKDVLERKMQQRHLGDCPMQCPHNFPPAKGAPDVNFLAFPNPASDLLYLNFCAVNMARAYRLIATGDIQEQGWTVVNHTSVQLDLSGFPPGLYYLQVELADRLVSRKIMIGRL